VLPKKIKNFFFQSSIFKKIYFSLLNLKFKGSKDYWESRYRSNQNSGSGSYGISAEYKARFLNQFVRDNNVESVIELGCGDGNQLGYFKFPFYTGLDVALTAVNICIKKYSGQSNKTFELLTSENLNKYFNEKKELALSLDVIFHLVENDVFENYMFNLFNCASRFVIIYSWDVNGPKKGHVRQRNFSKWVFENIQGFDLIQRVKSQDFCDFLVYKKIN